MKRAIYILTTILFTLSGCDYLDVVPDNTATLDMAFHDRYNAEKFLFTCYSFLPSTGSENSDPGIMSGDELWYNPFVWSVGFGIANVGQRANDPIINNWDGSYGGKKMFVGIRDCNIFIDNVDKVGDLPESEKIRWKAEAKFIKAYLHWYLLRMYGPIPIMDKSKPINAPTEEFLGKRIPIDECFNYVLDLMKEAASELPLKIKDETSEMGRVTKPAAYAIMARVAVTYASPLFNGNDDFRELVDKEGTKLFDNTYDPQKWADAAEACRKAIDVSLEAGHRLWLVSDFNINRGKFSELTRRKIILRQAVSERWNPEIIWGNSTSTVGYTYQKNACPVYREHTGIYPTNQYLAAPLRIAEMFYSKNGVPISEDKTYDYSHRYELQTSTDKDSLLLAPNETTVKLHFDRELRFYSFLAFDRGAWIGNGADDTKPWYVRARLGEPAYKLGEKHLYNLTGYWPKKMIHLETEINSNGQFTAKSFPFPVIRMADLYLMYAEALNEFSGPSAEVYQNIDIVRERAGLPGVVEAWSQFSTNSDKPKNKAGLRNIIHQERLIEFVFEGLRFWDLRRWKMSKSFLRGHIRGWNTLSVGDASDWYQVMNHDIQWFETRDYLWPIKEKDLYINSNLVQNIGW